MAGNLTLQSVGTATVIGSGTPSCPGNTITGSVTLQSNSAAVGLTDNAIKQNLTDQGNTAPTTLSGNAVSGNLTDQSNTASTILSGNTVGGLICGPLFVGHVSEGFLGARGTAGAAGAGTAAARVGEVSAVKQRRTMTPTAAETTVGGPPGAMAVPITTAGTAAAVLDENERLTVEVPLDPPLSAPPPWTTNDRP